MVRKALVHEFGEEEKEVFEELMDSCRRNAMAGDHWRGEFKRGH